MNFNYIETLVAKAKNGDVSSKEIISKEFRPMILNIISEYDETFLYSDGAELEFFISDLKWLESIKERINEKV